MALAVTHSTAADGTFFTDGATAWDASHTLTGTVATAQIADDAVTYAKIQDLSTTDVMLGRSTAGAGIVEEIPVTAAGRAILDDANAAAQRTTLGLAIGTDVQAYDAQLADIAALAVTDGNIIVGDGANWVAESGATARTSLGVAIGTDVLAYDVGVQQIADLADPNADRILFWDDSASAYKYLTAGTNLTITDTTIDAASGSGATLDAITAAAGDQAGIANADWNLRWNWQKTTNSEVAFEFGESAASTNGTSTSGVPNQVLAKFSTVAASTMSPLSVYSRAAHVFSVSPTAAQILAANGSKTVAVYGFASSINTGMFSPSTNIVGLTAAGSQIVQADSTGVWVAPDTFPTINRAMFHVVTLSGNSKDAETATFWSSAGSATGPWVMFRKSRGTPTSPSVITTGDDLGKLGAYGYVGATNKWMEAANITFDSTGTISDSTTGIGGIIRFSHAIVGAAVAEVGMFRSQHLIHEGTSPTITANGGTNPTIAGKDEAFDVTIGTGGTATDFTVTFANAFTTNAPVCIAQSDTDIVALKVVATTTTVQVTSTTAFTAGSKVHVICRGWE